MAAVILPAHDESAVLTRSLDALLKGNSDDEVIVVANGCSDDTAEIARRFAPRVTVVETPVGSKIGALNLGDQHASSYPRIYLDADIELKEGALDRIKQALRSGPWLAVSPEPIMDLSASSWAVKAYYNIWLSMPYCKSGMIGAGAYALSEEGRKRFGVFPDVIADDGYVRALFKEHERGKVAGAYALVRAPADLGWLLKIKTRSRMGGMQLAERFPELLRNEEKAYGNGTLGVLRNPLKWSGALVYLYVNIVSRILARWRYAALSHYRWEKDLSSRNKQSKTS